LIRSETTCSMTSASLYAAIIATTEKSDGMAQEILSRDATP
jgi:hypothetical protein